MPTATSCPTPEQLDDLMANRLSAAEAEALRRHLGSCPLCRGRREAAAGPSSPYPFLETPRAPGELGWLGGHRVLGVLGEGGMSIVFDAEDPQLGRRVALKVLLPRLSDPQTRERFLQEARLLAQLPHEHIVTVFHVGEANGAPYLTMERLEGTSLEERLRRDRWLPLAEALAFAREAAEGLAAAHEQGLVHRDVKPANLWLETRRGRFRRVKLIDFGIARDLRQDAGMTSAGQVLGTPMYMAPEQAEGAPVDGRADLYSLGCVLFHLLVGRPPFDARHPDTMALLQAVVSGEAPRVKEAAPGLPAPVAELIQQLLARDPAARPASARVLAERLRQLEQDSSLPAPTLAAPAPARRRLMRRPGLLGILLGITAVLAALVVSGAALYERYTRPGGREGQEEEHEAGPAGPGTPGGPPLKLGLLHSLSGTLAIHERPMVQATRMAVEEINAKGGVLGRPVEVFLEDGASEEDVFAEKARLLCVGKKVDVLFGCWSSASRKRVKDVCEKHGRLLFYSNMHEGLESSPSVVYLGGTPSQTLIPLVRWAYSDKRKRRFYLLGNDAVFSRAVNAILRHEITELGGAVAGERYTPFEATDFAGVVEEVRKSKADVIVNTIDGQSNVTLFRALRGAGVTPRTVSTVWSTIGESELYQFRTEEMLGDYSVACYFESLPGRDNQAFVRRFRGHHKSEQRVNDAMETAYFGVYLWKKAVEKAGGADTPGVRRALRGMTVDAPEGPVTVDGEDQHAHRYARVGEIVAGKGYPRFRIVFASPEPLPPDPFPAWRTRAQWNEFLLGVYRQLGNSWARHR